MSVSQDQLLETIASMTVLELSQQALDRLHADHDVPRAPRPERMQR